MAGSTTLREWLSSSAVNRFTGWSDAIGSLPFSGRCPESSAGTAAVVSSATVVAFGYQVESPERAARLGKRDASTFPLESASEAPENSSKTTKTTGVELRLLPAPAASTSSGSTRSDTGDSSRK